MHYVMIILQHVCRAGAGPHFFQEIKLIKDMLLSPELAKLMHYIIKILAVCASSWFGASCEGQCHCRGKGRAACDDMTGKCRKGCSRGWKGEICQEGAGR